jgi:hypothetical protein
MKMPMLFSAVALSLVLMGTAGVTYAQDSEDSAAQQAQDINHSSQDAVDAPDVDQAKGDSNQGFDTPNTDTGR